MMLTAIICFGVPLIVEKEKFRATLNLLKRQISIKKNAIFVVLHCAFKCRLEFHDYQSEDMTSHQKQGKKAKHFLVIIVGKINLTCIFFSFLIYYAKRIFSETLMKKDDKGVAINININKYRQEKYTLKCTNENLQMNIMEARGSDIKNSTNIILCL